MSLHDWPIGGMLITMAIAMLLGLASWYHSPAPPIVAQPAVSQTSATETPAVVIDRDKTFAEFRAISLGLPTVWTFSPHPPERK